MFGHPPRFALSHAMTLALTVPGLWLAALGLWLPTHAHAANWLDLFGNEPHDAPIFRPFGLLQPTYTHYDAEPVSGLTGPGLPYDGQYQFANLVGPDLDGHSRLQFNRARIGARGVLRPLSDRINYFLMLEAGRNAMTAERDLMLSDASLSFNFIPGARVRAGLFKQPFGEESQVAIGPAYPYVYFSHTTQNLLVEQHVQASTLPGSIPDGLAKATPTGGCSCFHDWGVQVYDSFRRDAWELSYALMWSNGQQIDDLLIDHDGNKDLTVHLRASHVFGGDGPNRQDASVYAWRQQGDRRFGSSDHERLREGVGFKVQRGPLRASGEYIRGEGMILAGPFPAFANAPHYAIGLDEAARGWYLEGGWRLHPKWAVDLRHERFDMFTHTPANAREITVWTLGLQHFIDKQTRLTLNYEWREQGIPYPSAIPVPLRAMATNLADNFADRVSLQLSWWF